MATEAEVALLRKLVGDTADPPTYSDAELDAALEAAAACPVPTDKDGFPEVGVPRVADTYGVAAQLWEDRALAADMDTTTAEPVRVTSERNGDVSRSYAGGGKLVGERVMTPEAMRAMARRLRKRSCNGGAARTIVVDPAGGRLREPVRGELLREQLVN